MTAATRISTAAATSAHVPSRRMLIGAALGIVYVVWGSTYLAIRIMVGGMPPLAGAGARFLTAGLLVAVVLVARGGLRRMVVTGRELAGCALIAVLLPVLGQGLVTVGEKGGAPSGITALLIAAVPLWVICYRILSGERPARRTLAGVFLGFGGVAVVIAANGVGGAFPPWTIAVVVLAGLSWAFGSWYQPRLRLPGDPFVVVVYEMLVGGGVLTVLGLASGEGFHPLEYSARSWVAWAYLVVFGSVVAFSAYVWLLQSAAVSLAATYAYVNPLVAVLLGRLILAEPVTMPTIAGGAVVVAAVAIVVSSERPPPTTTASETRERKSDEPGPRTRTRRGRYRALNGEPRASAMSPCPAWRLRDTGAMNQPDSDELYPRCAGQGLTMTRHGLDDDDREEAVAEPMSPKRRQEFLMEGTRTAILATARTDGRPHAVPVCFVLDGDDILFLTNADSVKGAHMRRDPRVTLVVDDETPPFAFAMIEGTAEMSQNPDELRHAAVEISHRYNGGENIEQFVHFATAVLGSLVRIRPTRTLALDRVGEH